MNDPDFLWWALGVCSVIGLVFAWRMDDIDIFAMVIPVARSDE